MPTVAERTAGIVSVSTRRPLGSVVFSYITPALGRPYAPIVRPRRRRRSAPADRARSDRGAFAAARAQAKYRSRRGLRQIAADDRALRHADRHARPEIDLLRLRSGRKAGFHQRDDFRYELVPRHRSVKLDP